MTKSETLRKKYPKFVYEDYSWKITGKDLRMFFNFRIEPDIFFKPKINIKDINQKRLEARVGDRALDYFVFHLGLMEIPSYWKATCSPEIEIRAGYLNRNQIKWWKDYIGCLKSWGRERKFSSPAFGIYRVG